MPSCLSPRSEIICHWFSGLPRRRAGLAAGGRFQFEPAMLARGFEGQEDEWLVDNGGLSGMANIPRGLNACVNSFAQQASDWILPRITEFA
jgi:hypothetical protein